MDKSIWRLANPKKLTVHFLLLSQENIRRTIKDKESSSQKIDKKKDRSLNNARSDLNSSVRTQVKIEFRWVRYANVNSGTRRDVECLTNLEKKRSRTP